MAPEWNRDGREGTNLMFEMRPGRDVVDGMIVDERAMRDHSEREHGRGRDNELYESTRPARGPNTGLRERLEEVARERMDRPCRDRDCPDDDSVSEGR
jgi:hypothetical protein